MEALQLLVPAVATVALGGALLVPIRDGRAGRKATLDGRSPLLADFRNVRVEVQSRVPDATEPADAMPSVLPESAQPDDAAPARALDRPETPAPPPFDPIALMRTAAKHLRLRAQEPTSAAEVDLVTERSFADELSSLLPQPPEADAAPVPGELRSEASPAVADTPDETTVELVERQHDVTVAAITSARVVPLTRLPLRRQSKDVTWPASASPPRSFTNATERYAFLRAACDEADRPDDALLARAFREETSEGRMLALAALRRSNASKEAIETFTEALGTGSDEERALAVDALSEAGAREQIARGLTDRIDAIAAKAALAYVGTTARDDYRLALSPLIDESRIETILALLAGVVE
jgi:hypothetical protein